MQQTKTTRCIKTVKCPYMPQHIMPAESLLNHLSRCSATNKHLFTKCKYNPIHVYPNELINDHYRKCKDKAKFAKRKESSDDWGVQSDDDKPKNGQLQTKKQQNKNNHSILGINQSAISLKTDPQSDQEWIKIDSSDQEVDYESTQNKIQNISISCSKTSKNQNDLQKSIIQSQSPFQQTKNDITFGSIKNSQSASRSIKKEFLNDSDKFQYEESQPQFEKKHNKITSKTVDFICKSETSRDNQFKKTDQSMRLPKFKEDDDVEVQDF